MFETGSDRLAHTPGIAFRHLPPNSARFGYATEGSLFTSVQLSNDAVSNLRKAVEATQSPSMLLNIRHVHPE